MLMGVVVAMVIVLCALAAVFLLYPVLYGSRQTIKLARNQDRLAVYEARTEELADEKARGLLDEAQHEALQAELDRQILAETESAEQSVQAGGRLDWRWALLTLAAMAIMALVIYQPTGARQAVELYELTQVRERSPEDFERFLVALEDHVDNQRRPDIEDLYMLALSYDEVGRAEDAINTYDRVEAAYRALDEYDPEDLSVVLSNRGQTRFIHEERRMSAATEADFEEALRLDPMNTQALATLGMAHMDAGNPQQAVVVWERFLEVAEPGRMTEAVAGALEHARQLVDSEAAGDLEGVQVVFSALPEELAPDAFIYIVARTTEGGSLVALQRYTVADMPLALRLTDRDRSGDMPALSSQNEVEVVAFATPPGANLNEATHSSRVVVVPVSGEDAVATLSLELRGSAGP
ncbi:MAG: c-type cytochrome biogenesis protein CcmI [Natronospirillum sp.]|uniref:c-type cytochrome biogenesis protein CcmI n=1 Tax=Natronospirillum sp. TaxID=2812955 RepID=UPI0025F3364D|nr:c-type cytochrome biogenesis protein CcmI [Natronospirillum sp.]MCH8551385.1 c-type cytochrome biogenesis protein CcmI [Natronospirillum sp.]